jgi:hypothetical protein
MTPTTSTATAMGQDATKERSRMTRHVQHAAAPVAAISPSPRRPRPPPRPGTVTTAETDGTVHNFSNAPGLDGKDIGLRVENSLVDL